MGCHLIGHPLHGGRPAWHDPAGAGASHLLRARHRDHPPRAPQGACAAALLHRDARPRGRALPGQDRHDHLGPYGGRGRVCGRRPRRGRARGGLRRRSPRFRVAADARCALWHRPGHVGRCERDLHGGPCALSRPRPCARGQARHRFLLRQEVERRSAHGRCVRLRFGRVRHGRLAVRAHAGCLCPF